jgi:hypothetical protein
MLNAPTTCGARGQPRGIGFIQIKYPTHNAVRLHPAHGQRLSNLEIFRSELGISLAPWLQPGAKRQATTLNRFNGLPDCAKAVETAPSSPPSAITGLKPRC